MHELRMVWRRKPRKITESLLAQFKFEGLCAQRGRPGRIVFVGICQQKTLNGFTARMVDHRGSGRERRGTLPVSDLSSLNFLVIIVSFCIDLDSNVAPSSVRQSLPRLELVKQAVSVFVHTKAAISNLHSYAICALVESALRVLLIRTV